MLNAIDPNVISDSIRENYEHPLVEPKNIGILRIAGFRTTVLGHVTDKEFTLGLNVFGDRSSVQASLATLHTRNSSPGDITIHGKGASPLFVKPEWKWRTYMRGIPGYSEMNGIAFMRSIIDPTAKTKTLYFMAPNIHEVVRAVGVRLRMGIEPALPIQEHWFPYLFNKARDHGKLRRLNGEGLSVYALETGDGFWPAMIKDGLKSGALNWDAQ